MKFVKHFAAAALLTFAVAAPAVAADKVKFSYVVPSTFYADLIMGVDQGYFAQEGIDAELMQAGGGAATPALLAGDIQFSGSPAAAITAILKGAKLKVIFVTSDRAVFQLWSRPDIKTLADLKGQTVGVISRGDTTEIAMRYYFVRKNLPEDYTAFAPLGTGTARMAGISSGSYAASVLDKTDLAMLRASNKLDNLHMLVDLHQDVHMTFSGFAITDALLNEKPDLARRAMRAIIKAMIYTKTHREESIKAIMKFGGVADRKVVESDYDGSVDELSTVGTMALDDQKLELQVRGEMLGLAKDKIGAPSQVFDFRATEKAGAELKAENWKP